MLNNYLHVIMFFSLSLCFSVTCLSMSNPPDVDDEISSLRAAVRNGDVGLVVTLIQSVADEPSSYSGITALHEAAVKGDAVIAEKLLKAHSNVNAHASKLGTPLHCAVKAGHMAVVALLLEHNAHINSEDNFKLTPLHYAAGLGNQEIALYLIKMGADKNARGPHGETPLHRACHNNKSQMVYDLVRAGVDLNVLDQERCTPLQRAFHNGHLGCALFLLESDAVMISPNDIALTKPDEQGYTLLHHAVGKKLPALVGKIIDAGADVDAGTGTVGTPLLYACLTGQQDIIEKLLHAKAHTMASNRKGMTPLHYIMLGDEKLRMTLPSNQEIKINPFVGVLKKFLEYTNVVNVPNGLGHTPLSEAISRQCVELIPILLAKNAATAIFTGNSLLVDAVLSGSVQQVQTLIASQNDVTQLSDQRFSLLHKAAAQGNKEIAAILLDAGCSSNGIAVGGITPLHEACLKGHTGMAEMLIERGASCNAGNGYFCGTPLHYAVFGGYVGLIHFLINKGADHEAKTGNGFTPLTLASKLNKLDCIIALLNYVRYTVLATS